MASGIAEIVRVDFDLWTLQLQLWFRDHPPVYVRCRNVRGFRALDEGDLLEFWDPKLRPAGWLWEIERGGWFDLESSRAGFVSGLTGGWREFLVLGDQLCVSILSPDAPVIEAVPD